MAKREAMNLRQYWDEVGTANVHRVIDHLGSSLPYFRQLRYGLKTPSEEMAERIIEAAKRITPSCVPDAQLLRAGVPRATRKPGDPSPEFLAAQKRAKQNGRVRA